MTESDRNRNALEGLGAIQRLAEAELKRHYDVDWPGPGPCELTAEETARLHDPILSSNGASRKPRAIQTFRQGAIQKDAKGKIFILTKTGKVPVGKYKGIQKAIGPLDTPKATRTNPPGAPIALKQPPRPLEGRGVLTLGFLTPGAPSETGRPVVEPSPLSRCPGESAPGGQSQWPRSARSG